MQSSKNKFILTITILLIVSFMATTLLSYFVARHSLSSQTSKNSLPLVIDIIHTEIKHNFIYPIYISSIMANDSFVENWINSGEKDSSEIEKYLRGILKNDGIFTSFFISEKTKRYYHPNKIERYISEDNPDENWYFKARSVKKNYDIVISEDEVSNSRLTIFINHKVVDKNGKFLGIIGVGFSLDYAIKLIIQYRKKYHKKIYFLNMNGNIILSEKNLDKTLKMDSLKPYLQQILKSQHNSIIYEIKEDRIFLNSKFIKELNWHLIVEENESATQTSIKQTLFINIIGALIISIIIIYLIQFSFKSYQIKIEKINSSLSKLVKDEVSTRVKIMKEKKEQETLLIQQSKIAELGEMMGAIIHQWKHPLNTIGLLSSQIGLFNAKRKKPNKELEIVESQIMEKLNFMNDTLNDFHNFFKPSKEKELFSPCYIIKKVKEMFKGQFGDSNVNVIIYPHKCFKSIGYPTEFMHVILNIFNNSKDNFINKKQIDGTIECFFEIKDDIGFIYIRDNGGGVSKSLLPDKLFKSYVSTKGKKNMGFGLYISKNIIENRMGGKIWAHNIEKGVEFTIELKINST